MAPETVDRLAAFAAGVSAQAGQTFEAGIAQAMTAVLASPGVSLSRGSGRSGPFRELSTDR